MARMGDDSEISHVSYIGDGSAMGDGSALSDGPGITDDSERMPSQGRHATPVPRLSALS